MSISRKEDGSLVRKAGLGIVDNILNRFSHNAISNSAVTEAITEINNDLTDVKDIADFTFSEHKIGTYNGKDLYRRLYHNSSTTITTGTVIDSSFNLSYVDSVVNINGTINTASSGIMPVNTSTSDSFLTIRSIGLYFGYAGGYGSITKYDFIIEYTKS